MSINDQLSEDADIYDFSFYQKILRNVETEIDVLELKAKSKKGYSKLGKNEIFGAIKDELFDDLGIYDLHDELIEWENDFREEHGLGHKMTHEEISELKEKERKLRENNLEEQKRMIFEKEVEKQRRLLLLSRGKFKTEETGTNTMSTDEQIKVLKKLKDLLDAKILTEEEFTKKKNEIL